MRNKRHGEYDGLVVAINAGLMILTGAVGAFLLCAWWLGFPAMA